MTYAAWTIHPRTWALAIGVSCGLWVGIIVLAI